MKTMPLLALLFVPIAWGLHYIYPWAQPATVAASANLQYKQFYLNPTFFLIRTAIYFLLAIIATRLLTSQQYQQQNARLSKYGLVVYGIATHFLAIDWLMSLEPTFHSSIFGPVVALGQLLSAYALSLIVFAWTARRPLVDRVVSRFVLLDLGNLLLVFLVTWAYMEWFQFMLIWIANLPGDVIWYLSRGRGGWRWVTWAIVVFQFAVPFVLLLFRAVKQRPAILATVAGLILFMQLVHRYYQVMPAFPTTSMSQHWMNFLTPLGIGGVWLAMFLRSLGELPLLPQQDKNAAYAEQLRHLDQQQIDREKEEPIPELVGLKETELQESADIHSSVRYEPRDVRFRWVMAMLFGLLCMVTMTYFVMWKFFTWQKNTTEITGRSHYPLAQHAQTQLPPPPRLEQLNRMEKIESSMTKEKMLHSYGTTDEKEFVRIPIEKAIQVMASQLPVKKDLKGEQKP